MTAGTAPGVAVRERIPDEILLEMYRRMSRVRQFEALVQQMVGRGELPGAVHVSLGQEAQVVGAGMALKPTDYITGTHRSHGHPIGKGARLDTLLAEILGRRTGVCHGKGGSMHLADFSVGSLGESGVIASAIPVMTGAGFAAKKLADGRVALGFFGDGGANQGVIYECMNMAALWKLPVIFLCENNFYASTTPQHEVTAEPRLTRRAEGFGVPAVSVHGQDVVDVYGVVSAAVERARAGAGPTFVEVQTYRYSDHSEGLRFAHAYAAATRDPAEIERWRAQDPLAIAQTHLDEAGLGAAIATIEDSVADEVAAAKKFAESSPLPDPEEAFEGLYSTPIPIRH